MSDSQNYAHKIRQRACGLIIKDHKLLLVRMHPPTRNYPVWMPPGGQLHFGETLQEAVAREVKEETGLKISVKRLRYIHQFVEPPFHALEYYFLCDYLAGTLKLGSDPENPHNRQILSDVAFVSIEKLENIEVEPAFLKKANESELRKTVKPEILINPASKT